MRSGSGPEMPYNVEQNGLIVIEFAGQVLALDAETFEQARARGEHFSGRPTDPKDDEERLYTAQELEDRTGVPAAWFLDRARKGKLAYYALGKYRRFRFSEVLEATRARRN